MAALEQAAARHHKFEFSNHPAPFAQRAPVLYIGCMNPKERAEKLRQQITELRHEYHVQNNPAVTDEVYDSLSRELEALERAHPEIADPNSAIHRVAGAPLPFFQKVKHRERMLSLDNAFSEDELRAWEKRIAKIAKVSQFEYFCELKFDGLAISLVYENGKFIRGATRGDGFIGEDITENLKMIGTIPLVLAKSFPSYIEVRGEAIMKKSVWKKLNAENKKNGLPEFANTRNAAAGSLRQLDSALTKERHLDFFAYEISEIKGAQPKTHSEKHALLRKLGFVVDGLDLVAHSIDEILGFIKRVAEEREKLPFGTDGVVISVNDVGVFEELGVAGKAPRGMIAYKYPAERATTVITDITVSVGRTGVLTPVAHFPPTLVAGSTVSKATLHNMDQINRLDVRIGDTVVIEKAGDVIPAVIEVLPKMRTGKEKKFKMPAKCPICGGAVEQKDIFYYCVDPNCEAKNLRSLGHFVNAFEIYEIGPKVLERLSDEGLITDAADLFTLEVSDLSGLERFGEKSAENIISSIASHRTIPLWRFLYSLGILHVGEETARDLAAHFGMLPKLMKASQEQIESVPNIGPIVSKSVYDYFRTKLHIEYVQKLLSVGIKIEKAKKTEGIFSGKTFVITGTLPSLSRDEAKEKIISAGGKVSGSVSKNTSYVLVGENPGSKFDDATRLGVKTLSEAEFLKLVK